MSPEIEEVLRTSAAALRKALELLEQESYEELKGFLRGVIFSLEGEIKE